MWNLSLPPTPSIHLTTWMPQTMNLLCLNWIYNSVPIPQPKLLISKMDIKNPRFLILIFFSFLISNQSSNSENISIKMSKMCPLILTQTLIASCLEFLPWLLNWSKKALFPSMSWILCSVYFSNIWQSYLHQLYCKIKSNFSFWLFNLWKKQFHLLLQTFIVLKYNILSSYVFSPLPPNFCPTFPSYHHHTQTSHAQCCLQVFYNCFLQTKITYQNPIQNKYLWLETIFTSIASLSS